jgi:hypothetical protein
LRYAALVAVLALAGCATAVGGATNSATPSTAGTSPPARTSAHHTIDDAVAIIPKLPEVSWTPISEFPGEQKDPYAADSAGELVAMLTVHMDTMETDPCNLYRWAELVLSGSDAESQDPLGLLGVAVKSNTNPYEAIVYATVRAREFPTPSDANLWLDGFVATTKACPSTDIFGVDYVRGVNKISVADRQLSSGDRIVETVAVGITDTSGEGTYTVAVAADNVVVVVWFPKHETTEYGLESTAASDIAAYYAEALH